jgi:hypothetical protein
MSVETHGKIIGHKRFCDEHINGHGPLYPCPSYDAETLLEIEAQKANAIACYEDPEWRQQQIDKGIPAIIVGIFGALQGVGE